MSGTTGTVPLQTVVPDQLITSALWNGEFGNIATLLDAAGCGGHSDTDSDARIQTNPFPGSVLSKAVSIAGELERLRYQIAKILGTDYWYKPAATDLTAVGAVIVPVGGIIDFPIATPPSANFHLADGTAISRAGFAALFSLVGTTFGVGDGSSTFNLPDYRDRMSIGAGTSYAVATMGGATSQSLPSHTHDLSNHSHPTPNHQHQLDYTTPYHADPGLLASEVISLDGNGNTMYASFSAGPTLARLHKNQTQNSGSGTSGAPNTNTTGTTGAASVPTLPPYLAMYKLIRVL